MNAKEIVSQPSYIYSETDPFERAWARLSGIRAIHTLAECSLDSDSGPTAKVWSELWFFVATVTEDVKRDMYEMRYSSAHKGAGRHEYQEITPGPFPQEHADV